MTPFDAADPWSQELANWHPWLGSPDTEGNPYRDFIVSRIRDLVRNDGWASGAITRILDNVVGGGFRVVFTPDWQALSRYYTGFDSKWAREYASAVQAEFGLWSNNIGKYNDLGRRLGWGAQTRLACRNYLVEGDAIAVMHLKMDRVKPGKALYGTCVQVVDPDRLSNPNLMADQPTMRGGVEIDEDGVAVAYHFRRAHQAQWMEYGKQYTWERIPREMPNGRPIVVHTFETERSDTHRSAGGILKPVISRLKMLARYDGVELQAAIINAVLAAFIESPYDPDTMGSALEVQTSGGNPEDTQLGVYEDLRAEFHEKNALSLNGARIARLFTGEKLNLAAPTRPAQAFEAFEGAMLRNVAAATGLSEQQVSNNWKDVNYSSARGAAIEAWKGLSRIRSEFSNNYCRPIISCVMEEMHARRRVPLPTGAPAFYKMRTAFTRCRFMGPGRGWVDPVKEAQAAVLRMKAGLSTLEMECAEQGLDYEDVLYQRQFEKQLFKQLGIPEPEWFGPMDNDKTDREVKPE